MPRPSEPSLEHQSPLPGIVWPPRITRPTRPPALVYLDLNHYIYLARAAAGDPTTPAGYDRLLASCRHARSTGNGIFPLSGTHYIEMSAILDPAQRKAVATVMEQLSGFRVLLGRSTIAELEIEAMLDILLGRPDNGDAIALLGTSCLWAFGHHGGLSIQDQAGEDASASMRADMGDEAYENLMTEMNLFAERSLLAGPADNEIPSLRTNGYAPERTHAVTKQRAQQEREQAARLDAEPRWRRGRLRDVVGARELSMELIDALTRAVMRRGTTIGEVVTHDRNTIRAFAEGMPTSLVAITLKTSYHRNPQHNWTANDINDIDALSVAVAYCDAVFTDKAAHHALTTAAELRQLTTFLPRRPTELADWLDKGETLSAFNHLSEK